MDSETLDRPSIVEWFDEQGGHRCGYCKQTDTNHSHGMWAHTLAVQDYQDLIDRGWRRSGKYCYKPTMKVTCCPHYTIRCEALNFKLSKSHKKLLRKVNKYLIEGEKVTETSDVNKTGITSAASQSHPTSPRAEKQDTRCNSEGSSTTEKNIPRKGDGPDPNKPPCKKAKALRREKKLAKLAQKLNPVTEDDDSKQPEPSGSATSSEASTHLAAQKATEPKSIEDFLEEVSKVMDPAHKLEVRLVRSGPQSEEYRQTEREAYNVYRKYQMTIHKDPPEDCAKNGYTQFLVDSPLQPRTEEGGLKEGYGSFHQLYILDGKIIAVGVVDILPSCMSSVYLYYDPDYEFLSLGTYTALREIAFTRQLNKSAPDLKYYYMGYYIHSCPKMKYKGQYVPSFISCPEVYTWQPIEKCRPKLDQSNYSRLDEDLTKEDEDGKVDLDKVLILTDGDAMPYHIYRQLKRRTRDEHEIRQYAGFVGQKCYQRMLLFRK